MPKSGKHLQAYRIYKFGIGPV